MENTKKQKISFYDLAVAIQELSDHYDLTKIDHLIEELQDNPENCVVLEQDGLMLYATIEFKEEGDPDE